MRIPHGGIVSIALLFGRGRAYMKRIETTLELKGSRRRHKPSGKGIIMNVARSFNNWRKYRQTVNELGRMSNRELLDLGISRGDIDRIARGAVAR